MSDQSTQSITIDAPAAEVMAVIADFPAYPRWVAAAKQVEVLRTVADGRAGPLLLVATGRPLPPAGFSVL